MAIRNLDAAKMAKEDEFYTQLPDIERELQHYWPHLRGKTVLCNCDDPYESNFFKYFALRFNQLGLRNQNIITYKEVFPLLKTNKIWLGYKVGSMAFKVPAYFQPRKTRYWQDSTGQKWRSMGNICWFTNLDHQKRHETLDLICRYSPDTYPKYDNYDAINVDRVENIPCDYAGAMGVPITFLDKYNPNQFEIIGIMATTQVTDFNFGYPFIKGKRKFARILIRNKHPQQHVVQQLLDNRPTIVRQSYNNC